MKKFWFVLLSLITVIGLVVLGFFLYNYLKPKKGGVLVASTPAANVYINGALVGKTPYEGSFDEGEISVRVLPEGMDSVYAFESKVKIVGGVKTVVKREFKDDGANWGDIIYFEKGEGKNSSLSVITVPDNTQVAIDGVAKGFSPYRVNSLTAGEHQITISAVGYLSRQLTVNAVNGYRLSVISNLAQEEKKEEVKAETTEVKTMVEILTTPTGFLRVRTQPGSGGSEIHQVKPGEKYPFLEEDGETGWFKIQIQEPAPGLPDGLVGWVSNEFSQKVDEEVSSNSTN